MPQILFALQSAFSMWMLVDALQRRQERYWYFVVLMPFGELVYFFMVKIHDPDMRWLKNSLRLGPRAPSVDDLRYRLRLNPCQANIITLAQALYDKNQVAEAYELFAEALSKDPTSRPALLGSGASLHLLSRNDEAEPPLRSLIELEPRYGNCQAWAELAKVLWACDEQEACLELLSDLLKVSPRIAHRVVLAEYQLQAGRCDLARHQLEMALDDHQHGPRYLRRVNRVWARRAKALFKQIPAG